MSRPFEPIPAGMPAAELPWRCPGCAAQTFPQGVNGQAPAWGHYACGGAYTKASESSDWQGACPTTAETDPLTPEQQISELLELNATLQASNTALREQLAAKPE